MFLNALDSKLPSLARDLYFSNISWKQLFEQYIETHLQVVVIRLILKNSTELKV